MSASGPSIRSPLDTRLHQLAEGDLPPTLSRSLPASLYVDYVFLDTDERRRMAQNPHEYLIEQLQFTGDESVGSSSNKIKLNFNHPCKGACLGCPARQLTSTTAPRSSVELPISSSVLRCSAIQLH